MRRSFATFMCGVSALVLPAAAMAQAAPADAAKGDAAPAAKAPEAADIVVTGSRVVSGSSSPVPLTTITTDKLTDMRPTSLSDNLNTLPVFSGSRQATSNPNATSPTSGGNGSASQLNLRNMGAQRNLILIDGRRVPPSSINNIVDSDMIPEMLIQRVDVVTGGVSAVYGSDAVSGVVNFVTDRKFNGLKFQASGGISKYADDPVFNIGGVYGTKFADDKGHFEISYNYRNDAGISNRSSRSWLNRPNVIGSGTAASPYQLVTGGTLPNTTFGGRLTCATCALNGQNFASNGVLSAFNNGAATGTSALQVGGDGGYYDNSLKASLRSHQVYGRLDYDFSDSIRGFIVGAGTFKHNEFYQDPVLLNGLNIGDNNAFIPAAYQSALAGTGSFQISKLLNQATDDLTAGTRLHPVIDTRQYMFTGGLSGKIANRFDWNLTGTHGSTTLASTLENNVNWQNLYASLDAVNVGGKTVCAASITNPTAYGNCSPLNLFGPSAASQQALNYILQDTHYRAVTKQDDITADISGALFDGWAGPIKAALSGEWRRQTFHASSDALPTQTVNCAGLTTLASSSTGAASSCSSRLLYSQTLAASAPVSQAVWELAAETDVPLLRDVKFARSLNLTGAARYTHYDTVGSYWTWKIGASWEVDEQFRVRGAISRDIRAPTLNDLFAPASVSTLSIPDRLTGVTTSLPNSYSSGNPNLTAEVGVTKTLGVVWKPNFFKGFTATVDYYDIKVKNAILQVTGWNDSIQAACYGSGGSSPYCALQSRPGSLTNTAASNTATAWYTLPINIGRITTYGVDTELSYVGSIRDHAFSLRSLIAYQPHIRYIQPGVPDVDQGGVAQGNTGIAASPAWRITTMGSFNLSNQVRVDVENRWRSAMLMWPSSLGTWVNGQNHVSPYSQTSINLSFKPEVAGGHNFEFFVNVQNVFNNIPPVVAGPSTAGTPGQYNGFAIGDDVIGRYFTGGVRVRY